MRWRRCCGTCTGADRQHCGSASRPSWTPQSGTAADAKPRHRPIRTWFCTRSASSPSWPAPALTSPVTGGCPRRSAPSGGPPSEGWPPMPSPRCAPRAWTVLADRYLGALDEIARTDAAGSASRRTWDYHDPAWARRERAGDLAEWHDLLLDRLDGSEAGDRLDRLASHPVLGSPEL